MLRGRAGQGQRPERVRRRLRRAEPAASSSAAGSGSAAESWPRPTAVVWSSNLQVELTWRRGDEVAADPAAPSGMRALPQPARATPSPTTATARATTRIPIKTREPALSFQECTAGRETRSRPAAYSRCRSDQRQETRIFIDVPSSLRTRIFTPAAGSFTPWFGSSGSKYCLVSSNSGVPASPRM